MSHTLTLVLPDEVYGPLEEAARQTGRPPEEVAVEWLSAKAEEITDDPLLKLAGTIQCDLTDIGERHHYYIGQALWREMRGEGDE